MARIIAMSQPAWRESVITYIRTEAQPADKFGHQPRLYALTSASSSAIALRTPRNSRAGITCPTPSREPMNY